jgi:hypothetical protein
MYKLFLKHVIQFSILLLLWSGNTIVGTINGCNIEILIASHRERPQGQSLILLGFRLYQQQQENSGEITHKRLLAINPEQ